ncbi:hypothetical protein [Algoriphagus namhaensis]
MKTRYLLFLSALVLVFACSDAESPQPVETINENLLKLEQILAGPLETPIGSLKSEFFYYGPETLQYRMDYYYDREGKELLKVKIRENDTTGIYLHEYLPDGKLDRVQVFSVSEIDDKLFHNFDFQRVYNSDEPSVTVLQGGESSFRIYEKFWYDEDQRLVAYRRGDEVNYDLHEYFYEETLPSRIKEEHYRQSGMTEPFYRYRYDYSTEGRLVAKSLQLLGPEFRPAFEYHYDEEGRLAEEITNYLYIGTQPIERKTYRYY